jgi:hypothetical protein
MMMNDHHAETVLHQMQDDDLDTARAVDGANRFHIGVSAQVAELFSALAKCQAEIQNPQRNAENPFFKSSYADLTAIWDVVRGPLSQNGLSISQFPGREGDEVLLTTVLAHESGQYIISRMAMTPEKDNPHGQASCITYMRRFALAAATGCAPAGEDDDGNSAVQPPRQQSAPDPAPVENGGNGKRGRKSNSEKLRERLIKIGINSKEDADLIIWFSTNGELLSIDDAKSTAKKASQALNAINDKLVVEAYSAHELLRDAKERFESTHDLESWSDDESQSTDAMLNGPLDQK